MTGMTIAKSVERPLIEICADGFDKACVAEKAGADRIELCSDLSVGGITPPREEIHASAQLTVPVNVLVRPRSGDFCHTPAEKDIILKDIRFCGTAGVHGVVIGALTPAGRTDLDFCREAVALARREGLSVTFHRAIDTVPDILSVLEEVLSLGVDRILTSGGAPTAWEDREMIAEMIRRSAGRAVILGGSGVTADNALALVRETGLREIHGSRTGILNAFTPKF